MKALKCSLGCVLAVHSRLSGLKALTMLAMYAAEVIHPRSGHIGDQPVIDEAGRWVGESTGLRGPQGEPGAMGETGATGPAGISIASAAVVDGQLKLTLSNGMVVDAGSMSGHVPKARPGNDGAQGPQGPQGVPGNDGVQST